MTFSWTSSTAESVTFPWRLKKGPACPVCSAQAIPPGYYWGRYNHERGVGEWQPVKVGEKYGKPIVEILGWEVPFALNEFEIGPLIAP